MGEDGVIVVQGGGDDLFIEDGISQDVNQVYLSLGSREAETVDGDFVGGGVQNQGHSKMEGACLSEHLISFTSQSSVLLSDCFRMSFQLGVVFCSSQEIRGFPCQETMNRMPELEFRVYQST